MSEIQDDGGPILDAMSRRETIDSKYDVDEMVDYGWLTQSEDIDLVEFQIRDLEESSPRLARRYRNYKRAGGRDEYLKALDKRCGDGPFSFEAKWDARCEELLV